MSRQERQPKAALSQSIQRDRIRVVEQVKKFEPTASQKVFMNKIRENTLTIVDSPAGVGKTLATLATFAEMYLSERSLDLVVIRTPVELGLDRIGFLPDSAKAKVEPHFASTKVLLEQLLGKNKVEADLDKRIHFKIPNFVLGSTLDNSLILIDEAQTLSPAILKLLLERVGKNSKVVVSGCTQQNYTDDKKRDGLEDCIRRFFSQTKVDGDTMYAPRYDDVALHFFDIEDVMRSDFVKTVIRAYGY